MADRISNLPDSVICHILSFLPTKDSVATSLLSKRWKPLWRSVPALNFKCNCSPFRRDTNCNLLHSINAFLSSRDPLQSIQRFKLMFLFSRCSPPDKICCEWISDAVLQHRLEHLHLKLPHTFHFPSVVLSCKTLVVLKLYFSKLESFSSVDLPSLQVLHLFHVFFPEYRLIAELLSGCPNLEKLEICGDAGIESYATEAKFKKLPKLLHARVMKGLIPLEIVSNVQHLRIDCMDKGKGELIGDLIPTFHSLTYIQFSYEEHNKYWLEVLRVLEHCPKLEHIFLNQVSFEYKKDGERVWQYPMHVPKCISSHLKTCWIITYGGHEEEYKFLSYILQNARELQKMVIHTNRYPQLTSARTRLTMRNKLSMFSSTCKISLI